ncbi:hypothetical protein [Paraburkholderia graminis]|uniref:Uncharacterized protein n=1 Tax=Paraburkholderia graminis TaxID=60548 RepID=A0ABD5CC58_9BURK|nr:hypothetical protein [Paraburkholderia graminis]MDR6202503.1 hypothetical protein [Paraburkholderia graminis]
MASPNVGVVVNDPAPKVGHWRIWHSVLLTALVALLFLVPFVFFATQPTTALIGTFIVLLLICVLIGQGVTGLPAGILIDERNVMSLSRLQMLVWTLMVVSAMIAGTAVNIQVGDDAHAAMGWTIDSSLLALIGISTISLAGSPLILSTKKDQNPTQLEVKEMKDRLKAQSEANPTNDGKVATNEFPSDARWSDMFTGEEVGNAGYADLSRIQMFFFTVLVGLIYAMMLLDMFSHFTLVKGSGGPLPFTGFPELDKSLVGLIAISHGGYLTVKSLPHTKSADSNGDKDSSNPVG